MKWLTRITMPLLLAITGMALHAQPAADNIREAGPTQSLLVRSVSVIDPVTAAASPPQDILIVKGLISSVSPAGSAVVSDGLEVVDGHGLFAIPGLIDVHAHLGEGGAAPNSKASRDRALRQFLRYGVTTIFVPGATGAGDADLPELFRICNSAELPCPGLYVSGSMFTARGSHPLSTIFGMPDDVPAEVTEARGVTALSADTDSAGIADLIDRKKTAGVTAIKIVVEDGPPPWYPKPRLPDEQIAAIVTAAHARSLPVLAHISTSRQADIVADAGVDAIMHSPIDILPTSVAEKMAARHMWYVPTFSLYDGILTWARGQRESDPFALAGVQASVIESLAGPGFLKGAHADEAGALAYLENAAKNLRLVHQAGVPIALGTDTNNPFVYPGYSVHEELSLMVRAGLSPAEALQAATTGGAAFVGFPDRIGRIAPGFEGDLVLLARNPLERIENTRSLVTVISDGKLVTDIVPALNAAAYEQDDKQGDDRKPQSTHR